MAHEEEVEEIEIITLTDEEGNEVDFGLLAVVEVEDKEFAILAPVSQLEAQDPELELVAFHYREVGESDVELDPVEDEELLEQVFAAAEEALFGDDLDEDEDEEEAGDEDA